MNLNMDTRPRTLKTRPATKSGLNQESSFAKLRGQIKIDAATDSTGGEEDTFLMCTVVGHRGRDLIYVEPIGTCGDYENEARLLAIDAESIFLETNDGYGITSFMELRLTGDIKVRGVERIEGVKKSPDVLSLLSEEKPVWRVTLFSCVEMPLVNSAFVRVKEVHPTEHAVTVEGAMFREPHYLHMGGNEMPTVDSIRVGFVHYLKFSVQPLRMNGGTVYLEVPPISLIGHEIGRNAENDYNWHVSNIRVMSKKDLAEAEKSSTKKHGFGLTKLIRPATLGRLLKMDDMTRFRCEPEGDPRFARRLAFALKQLEKPTPIKCGLCSNRIQPMHDIYFKACCLDECHLFTHRSCLRKVMASQGLRRKKEYKDGICPTEGCSAQLHVIYEFSIKNEEELYLKCTEEVKLDNKSTDGVAKKSKKKEKKSHSRTKEQRLDEEEMADGSESPKSAPEVVAVPATPTIDSLPAAAAGRKRVVLPPPKPNRSIPLQADLSSVVLLEKQVNVLEIKYAVPEQQPCKKVKTQRIKRNVLDIQVGIARDPKKGGKSRPRGGHGSDETETAAATNHGFSSTSRRQHGVSNSSAPSAFHYIPVSRTDDVTAEIMENISSCLRDLVFNTPPFDMGTSVPISGLKEALFLVAGDLLTRQHREYIEKLFATGPTVLVQAFVSKLKYFLADRIGECMVYFKNEAGRDLEQEQILVSMTSTTMVDGRRQVNWLLHECKICLERVGFGNEKTVLSCPECVEPYHVVCVRRWLSTNSTCPQCRGNWPDPIHFPGLGTHS